MRNLLAHFKRHAHARGDALLAELPHGDGVDKGRVPPAESLLGGDDDLALLSQLHGSKSLVEAFKDVPSANNDLDRAVGTPLLVKVQLLGARLVRNIEIPAIFHLGNIVNLYKGASIH
jgi:hypothetical protein